MELSTKYTNSICVKLLFSTLFSTSCGKVCGKNEFCTDFGFQFCTESQNSPFFLRIRPFLRFRTGLKLWKSFPQACGETDCPKIIHRTPWTSSPSFPRIRGGKFSTATRFAAVKMEKSLFWADFLTESGFYTFHPQRFGGFST